MAKSSPHALIDITGDVIAMSTLKPNDRNPRKITSDALKKLCESIERDPQFMELRPIVIDEGRMILGGNQRFRACQQLGKKEVPASWVKTATGLTDEQRRRFIIVDNAPDGMAGEWDMEILAAEWQMPELGDLGFDLDSIMDDLPTNEDVDAEPQIARAEELRKEWGVETGQMWQMGEHRLLCGDSTKREDIERLMAGALADCAWTDPPWNVAYGKSDHPGYRKREIANDDLGDAFPGFCAAFCAGIKGATKPGAALYMAMSPQEWPTIDGALRTAGFHWSATIIWAKDSLVLSRRDYHRQYEPVWYGWNPDAPRLHPLEDRKQSDLWNIPRPKRSEEHPTMKPVELVARGIRNSSSHGDLVFEPFSGSGTTIVACEQTGRACRAIEISPGYVAVALQRFKDATGKQPVLVAEAVGP